MSFAVGRGGGMVGGGAGGGRGGGRGRGRGGRGGSGHGGDDDEARKVLIRNVGAKKRTSRRWLIRGLEPPLSLRDYVPGGRYFDHLLPVVHDAEETFIAQAVAASEAAIVAMLLPDAEEIEAQMAVFWAREEAEHAAKRARVEDAVVLDDDK